MKRSRQDRWLDDRRSIWGYCIHLRGNLIISRNEKQNVVGRASTRSEFRLMTMRICLKIILTI